MAHWLRTTGLDQSLTGTGKWLNQSLVKLMRKLFVDYNIALCCFLLNTTVPVLR